MCFLKLGSKDNKRRCAMHKLTNVVHSGWLTKSPPEQKLQSPIKIFRAKWKQRFFVLHKPTGSLPDQYELSYYNSEQCSKKKGSIDLDQCEQIIESLDSDQYPYLLAIKTICRGKVRTYYLATNSEESMTTWVQCLCRVCGLKQEETPTDIPDARLSCYGASSATPPGGTAQTTGETAAVPPSTVTSQPAQAPFPRGTTTTTSSSSSSSSQPPLSTSPQSYVFLNNCTTGPAEKRSDRYGRTDSVDSVPEYQAPPPPAKKGSHNNNNNEEQFPKGGSHDNIFDVYDRPPPAGQDSYNRPRSGFQDVYDRPRSGEFKGVVSGQADDDFYKVPPPSTGGLTVAARGTRNSGSMGTVDLNSAVPLPVPPRSPRSARSSFSDRPDSAESFGRPSTEFYDVPPSGHKDHPVEVYDVPPPGFSDRPMAETYDIPPVDRPGIEMYDVPPADHSERPVSENYDFPPPRSPISIKDKGTSSLSSHPTPPQRPPKPHNLMAPSVYQNMPTKGKGPEESGLNAVPSAPPARCTPAALSYDVPRSSTVASPPRESSILDVTPPRPVPVPRNTGALGGQAYQNAPPVLPPLPDPYQPARNGEKREAHADRDGPHPKPVDMSKAGGGGRESQDLYQVPPVAPRVPMRSTTVPPSRGGTSPGAVSEEVEAHCIWSNTRTKSFKRNHQVNMNSAALARPHLEPRRPPLPLRNEFASSSDDDDDVSVNGSEIQTHVDPGIIRMSTTVPVSVSSELELKYLDLDLDSASDASRPQAAGSHAKGTEYREIDFDRTQALQDARRARQQMEK